ncbi:DBF4-type zinc finger-containing protein 2 isoform X1 [Amblyraja radiata]|uniref:DBF4-type zinc finger-containing protein 2 isoform X1 n=2 Tax=Amblyraja radiata TaxID=386614 RepID=UPI001401C9F1|nr:DBF4-type zinc finger-containing protein 2 isoform X1 [Amblyraja radiata]
MHDAQTSESFTEMTDNASGAYAEQPNVDTFPMQSKRGYCGCCQELYTCLEQHLQTTRHKQSAGESRCQVVAKSLMERFLQDVIQYHPSRYKDNRPTYMDLPSISAPLIPKKEVADIHAYQDEKETREELPSTDNDSVQSAHVLVGKSVVSCNQTKDSNTSSLPVGDPVSGKDTAIKEPASVEQAEVSSSSYKELCRTAFLTAREGILSCSKVDRHGSRIALGIYKPMSRRGIKDCNKLKATGSPGSEDHEHWNPMSQMNFPNVSSGPVFKFSKLHHINSQGTIAGPPLPQLGDHMGPSGPHCPGGPSQLEECKPHSRNTAPCPATLKETKVAEHMEDLVTETIETVIQKHCSRQASRLKDSDSENSMCCQLQCRRKTVGRGLQRTKWPPERDHGTPSSSCEMTCSRQTLQETASCFKKMLSLTLSCETKSGGQRQGTGEDVASLGGSTCFLGSQLGQLESSSSSEWNASVKVEKRCSRIPVKDLELITDARISLEDPDYKTRLSSVLRLQTEECDKMEVENAGPAESSVKAEYVEEKTQHVETEQRLQSLPYVPPSFAGKTWSEIMTEDDLKVEALVKEFKEGRYLCYFDSESLANHGRKQKKHRDKVMETSKGTCKESADSSRSVPVTEALPHLQEGNEETELPPTLGQSALGKKPALRQYRMASRCQVVKVSHATQTSEAGYPVVKKKSRRMDQEPENFWSGPDQVETPSMKTRLCSLRLPRSYSRIMSPVQPRTVIYVLSSPDFESTVRAASLEGKRSSRTWQDGANPAKYKYKKSPVRYYDPTTNRILKTLPASLGQSHHVRQLFRSLSPDINAGSTADEHRGTMTKIHPKTGGACSLLQACSNAASSSWPAGLLKPRDWALGEAPGSDSRSDGPPLPLQKNLVLSPLRRGGPDSPFGRLQVYAGPRSRRHPDREAPGPASTRDELQLSNPRGTTLQSDIVPSAPASSPGRPRLRSGIRRPADKGGSSGEKVLRRETRSGEKGAKRRGRRQGLRKRK